MLLVKIILLSALTIPSSAQVTRLVKKDVFLSRRKRYLAFPMKISKPLMQAQPRGFNSVAECDVPFALPSDTRLYKKQRSNHYIHKREILKGFEKAFAEHGLNGSACVKRMICEAQEYVNEAGKFLVKDFISAIFKDSEMELEDSCHNGIFTECSLPFLQYTLGSFMAT